MAQAEPLRANEGVHMELAPYVPLLASMITGSATLFAARIPRKNDLKQGSESGEVNQKTIEEVGAFITKTTGQYFPDHMAEVVAKDVLKSSIARTAKLERSRTRWQVATLGASLAAAVAALLAFWVAPTNRNVAASDQPNKVGPAASVSSNPAPVQLRSRPLEQYAAELGGAKCQDDPPSPTQWRRKIVCSRTDGPQVYVYAYLTPAVRDSRNPIALSEQPNSNIELDDGPQGRWQRGDRSGTYIMYLVKSANGTGGAVWLEQDDSLDVTIISGNWDRRFAKSWDGLKQLLVASGYQLR